MPGNQVLALALPVPSQQRGSQTAVSASTGSAHELFWRAESQKPAQHRSPCSAQRSLLTTSTQGRYPSETLLLEGGQQDLLFGEEINSLALKNIRYCIRYCMNMAEDHEHSVMNMKRVNMQTDMPTFTFGVIYLAQVKGQARGWL